MGMSRCSRSTRMHPLLLLLLVVKWTLCCSSVTVSAAPYLSTSFCPIGWTLWSPGPKVGVGEPSGADQAWCVKPQTILVAPEGVGEVCERIFDLDPPRGGDSVYTGIIPHAVSIHSDEQNAWLQQLLDPIFSHTGDRIALGGAAGFGDIFWHDGTTPLYTHFAPSVNWETHSGCIAMQRDGFWSLVSCSAPPRPFVCAFVPHNGSNSGNGNTNNSSSGSGGGGGGEDSGDGSGATTGAPTEGGGEDAPQRPTRPPVPSPPPPCATGWVPHADKCYRLYAETEEVAEEGMNQQAAQQYCKALHPRITLTAVLSEDENTFLSGLVQDWAQDRIDELSRIRVFIGGIFTAHGSVGVWYEDALWYGADNNTTSFPSSPTWPTVANHFYSRWGAGEPSVAFGCVTVSVSGTWYAEDCREVLPFVCAYLNDGSIGTEIPSVTPESGAGSSLDSEDNKNTTEPALPPTELLCIDDWAYFAPTNRCYRVLTGNSVAAADLEQRCGQLLPDIAPPETIHAAAIASVEESAFSGQLVANAGLLHALIGASYIERGVAGHYFDGMTEWVPYLAGSLWATGQPTRDMGCMTVGPAGAWYYYPCDAPAEAYMCAYQAGKILLPPTVPSPSEVPPTSTTTTTTTTAPSNETRPLEARIASLSGAVHLVVAAGTVGVYTVSSAGGATDGLLLMFAPDMSEVLASAGWSESTAMSPCGGYKKQEYIFGVMHGVVTVTHPNETMRGRVCVSGDGVHYVPTNNITFEVVDVALHGFIPVKPSEEWDQDDDNSESSNRREIGLQVVGVRLRSSGALRLVLHRSGSDTRAEIHHLRLSSAADCMQSRYVLFEEELSVVEDEQLQPTVTYQFADVVPANGANLDRLHDDEDGRLPTEFFVCVAASKKGRASPTSNATFQWPAGNIPHMYPDVLGANMVAEETNGTTQVMAWSADGVPMLLYTLVPNLRVYVAPPHVVVRGMWALSPAKVDLDAARVLPPQVKSTRTLLVPQFSSPVIVFDGEGLREGMSLLLSRRIGECQRRQPTPGGNPTNPEVAATLDTFLAVSTLNVSIAPRASDKNVSSGENSSNSLAFVQLNLNHTGMWGVSLADEEQTWQVCFAYTPLLSFMPLTDIKIVVKRARILAVTTDEDNNDGLNNGASPELKISAGFSGLLRLWGLDVDMWSPSTLSNSEIAFAQPPPGNSSIADLTFQCTNTSLFYRQRTLGIVVPRSATNSVVEDAIKNGSMSDTQRGAAVVVLPPGFIDKETTRRMRVCLSVPLPFRSDHRVFIPTTATVDVRPVEVYFIGPYTAHFPTAGETDQSLTVVEIADNADDLVLSLSGYGLSDDMMLFLSEERCHPRRDMGGESEDMQTYIDRISRLNFTIMRPYDVPPKYRLEFAAAATSSDAFITLSKMHTAPSEADRIFGAARTPLFVCLYAPGTYRAVYPLAFKFVVRRPYVTSIRAACEPAAPQAVVTYSSFVDLVVEGFGLYDGEAAFVPAVDCSNATSFLWRSPVRTSGVPSMAANHHTGCGANTSSLSRYVNSQKSMSSWFLSLTQAHTARIGALEPTENSIDRFQWCVRYRDADALVNATTKAGGWRKGFVPTGILYQLIIPTTDGFLFGNSTTKHLTRKTRHPTLGYWEKIQLVGPLITHTYGLGNPLFMFLAEELVPCKKLKNYFINTNSSDRFITAVNGSAVIVPKLLTNTGTFKLCASAIYPERLSSEEGTEAALQFFELKGLRIKLVDPVYAFFSLNRTEYVTVEQGQEWALPVSGSSISNMSLLRFRPLTANCSTPMPSGLDDVIVRNLFDGLSLVGNAIHPPERGDNNSETSEPHYIVLERELIRGLKVQEYKVCFKPDRSTPWMSSGVVLDVREHIRRPTRYRYFADDGSEDVVSFTALPPTKIALEWLTQEEDTTNIVGAVARELAVALWCRDGSAAENNTNDNKKSSSGRRDVVPCGNWRRLMFVRPLDDDRDPCFVDFEAVQPDIIRGPFVLEDSILTIPRSVSRNVSFYPNATQPWIMCLETAPERWRESISPLVQLQFTTPIPRGFCSQPDDPSNTTVPFFGHERRAMDSSTDRTEAEGNRTLILHVEETSRVFYLNGYAIQRGFMLRFGSRCDEEVNVGDKGEGKNRTELVAKVQQLNNTLLYEEPLTIEDDHGVFLFPATHFARIEAPTLMCLSTDGGASYVMTNLSLTVLPSQIRRDWPADEARITELAFRRTLVVPRKSKGTVSMAGLYGANNDDEGDDGTLSSRSTRNINEFSVGAQVLLSSACHANLEGLPIITVTVPGAISVTETHTRIATRERLHICVRQAGSENESNTTAFHGFRPSGLFFRVLDVAVTSVTLHKTMPNLVAEENGLHHLVVRRNNESMLLVVTMESRIGNGNTSDAPNSTALAEIRDVEERYIDMLDTPGALSLFRLAKFRVGRPCSVPNPQEPEASLAPLTALTATFVKDTVRVTTQDGSAPVVDFALPLHTAKNGTVEPWSPSSLCVSVDGGRHYLSFGASYVSVSWAPTLRVQLSMQGENMSEDGDTEEVEKGGAVVSTVVHLIEQASLYGKLVDVRYAVPPQPFQATPLSRYVSDFTTDVLWTGFLQDTGFASGGELYFPPVTMNDGEEGGPLYFSANYRYRDIPTGLTLQLLPMSLHCIGEVPSTLQQLHGRSTGWLLPIPGPCGHTIQAGAVLRLVSESVTSCASPEAERAYAMDGIVVKPLEWAGATATTMTMPTTTLQLPTAMNYVPDGLYKVCVKKYLPSRLGKGEVYLDTPVKIEVVSSLVVNEVSGLLSGALAVFQGSETVLSLRGSVVPFMGDIRIALTPTGVVDVPDAADACSALRWPFKKGGANATHPVLWKYVVSFTVRLSPEDLGCVTNHTAYRVCYSVDGGLSFRAVGPTSSFLRLVILPPTIVGPVMTERQPYNPNTVTATAQRLERFVSRGASPSTASYLSPAKVSFFVDRPPSYFFGASECFVGNGIGAGSGRYAAGAIQALAVAVLRTDAFGEVCDGADLQSVIAVNEEVNPSWGDYVPNPLALPVFIVDARSGCLWEQAADNSSSAGVGDGVLRREWLEHTASLRSEGGLSAHALLGRAATREERLSRESISYLVCTSVDGVHFYSANAPPHSGDEGDVNGTTNTTSLVTAAPSESVAPLQNVSGLPLVLRVDPSFNGSYYARDIAVVAVLAVRQRAPTAQASLDLNSGAGALERFQKAVARLLQIDPALIVVRLAERGVVAPVSGANATQPQGYPLYTLSLSLLSDARVSKRSAGASDEAGGVTPSPELLLRYALLLRDSTTQASLLSTLLPPAVSEANLATVVAPYVNYTFGTGVDLHAARQQHRSELPSAPSEEPAWRERFAAIPHATLAADAVPDDVTNDSTNKMSWWAVPLLLVFPACLVAGSLCLYRRFLRFRPLGERRVPGAAAAARVEAP
ncbi:hypothetical protein DQ04_01031090 [Trypanosoma grayi]|uniref:hypothetical protein n=1 Tax=Trypanosoma grayi TaxID=71804 RepID=UPI0004F44B23|nr:hypothetical protein DQ04_01031090 [Trypanosoma grayi]KEG13396.1 hypothetical protein DQ04_01031090 [Trypanosoma grayi]